MTLANYLLCAGVFAAGYSLSLGYVTVFYHRGFTHNALVIRPGLRRFVARTGNWITGLDVKAWACMHRLHHRESDRAGDPHSPVNVGVVGVLAAQLHEYKRILVQLLREEPEVTAVVADIEFDVHWLNRHRVWYLPYVAHVAAAVVLWRISGLWLLGVAYVAGITSHPIQGWIVNAFGHSIGGRNFDTPDNSRNNALAAWLVWGEGLQNNHHAFPASARFAYRRWEADFGYVICRLLQAAGLVQIREDTLITPP
jgi:stearoyl-CoA desaturase (delta-9 desaturase)